MEETFTEKFSNFIWWFFDEFFSMLSGISSIRLSIHISFFLISEVGNYRFWRWQIENCCSRWYNIWTITRWVGCFCVQVNQIVRMVVLLQDQSCLLKSLCYWVALQYKLSAVYFWEIWTKWCVLCWDQLFETIYSVETIYAEHRYHIFLASSCFKFWKLLVIEIFLARIAKDEQTIFQLWNEFNSRVKFHSEFDKKMFKLRSIVRSIGWSCW